MGRGQFLYANNSNRFLAVPELAAQPFAVVGVPFDGAVTHRPGARFGPQEMRRASLMLWDGLHPFFGVSPIGRLGDALDMRLPNASPLADVRQQIQAQAAAHPGATAARRLWGFPVDKRPLNNSSAKPMRDWRGR